MSIGSALAGDPIRTTGTFDGNHLELVFNDVWRGKLPLSASVDLVPNRKSMTDTYQHDIHITEGDPILGCPKDGTISGPVIGEICQNLKGMGCP